MLDVGRRSARLVCVFALLALLALAAYSPPWSALAPCARPGQSECLATEPDGGETAIRLGEDGRPRAESINYLQRHSGTIQLALAVVALGGLALWRPRLVRREPS